jgi:uncharacterized membrane protein (DUF441 family)
MGIITIILFGVLGGSVTSFILRENTEIWRAVAAFFAGLVVAYVAGVAGAEILYGQFNILLQAVVGGFFGPLGAAVAARRWRPIVRAPSDMRSQ